tara:strand:- start:2817 stop:3041 length:225 start_codon:yes stop_codon:yes gene_type:complete
VKAKVVHRRQPLRTKGPENAASVNLLLYLPVGLMTLPSKYKFKVQKEEAAPSCPPRKPASKGKAAKTKASKGDA